MFNFDAWQLLGLKPTSSLNEARCAYYELARIVHPDHGGSADDMRMLHEAYQWVYQQLVGATFPITVDDPSKTPVIDMVLGMDRACQEECYERLKQNDDARTKSMALDWLKYIVERDLMAGNELRSIEEYIQDSIRVVSEAQDGMMYASVPGGYGNLMDKHENVCEYSAAVDETPLSACFSKELTIYEEPQCPLELGMNDNSLVIPSSVEDYSGKKELLVMTDYVLAHTEHVISNPEAYDMERLTK